MPQTFNQYSYPNNYFVMTAATVPTTTTNIWTTYQKPKRVYKKKEREVPNFTSGLEGKLYDALNQDASNIIRYLTTKSGEPTIDKQNGSTIYVFESNLVARKQSQMPLFDPTFFDPLTIAQSSIETRSLQFKVKLEVDYDGRLVKFAFNYGAST